MLIVPDETALAFKSRTPEPRVTDTATSPDRLTDVLDWALISETASVLGVPEGEDPIDALPLPILGAVTEILPTVYVPEPMVI